MLSRFRELLMVAHRFEFGVAAHSAESLYKAALKAAIEDCGNESAAEGLVLVDFADFLSNQGRGREAQRLEGRITRILRRHHARIEFPIEVHEILARN